MSKRKDDGGPADEKLPYDKRGPVIIVTGSVASGFKFFGPYKTVGAAERAANRPDTLEFWPAKTICILEKPKSTKARRQ